MIAGTEDMSEPMMLEREDAIKKIERDVRDVADLFQDVAMLVNQQGEQLDNIQSNLETTVTHTHGAERELKRVSRKMAKRQRWLGRICVCGCVVVVVVIATLMMPS